MAYARDWIKTANTRVTATRTKWKGRREKRIRGSRKARSDEPRLRRSFDSSLGFTCIAFSGGFKTTLCCQLFWKRVAMNEPWRVFFATYTAPAVSRPVLAFLVSSLFKFPRCISFYFAICGFFSTPSEATRVAECNYCLGTEHAFYLPFFLSFRQSVRRYSTLCLVIRIFQILRHWIAHTIHAAFLSKQFLLSIKNTPLDLEFISQQPNARLRKTVRNNFFWTSIGTLVCAIAKHQMARKKKKCANLQVIFKFRTNKFVTLGSRNLQLAF